MIGSTRDYLAQPSKAAATAAGEASWSNATHLVITDEANPRMGKLLRGSDVGIPLAEGANAYDDSDPYMVASDAGPCCCGSDPCSIVL